MFSDAFSVVTSILIPRQQNNNPTLHRPVRNCLIRSYENYRLLFDQTNIKGVSRKYGMLARTRRIINNVR